MDYDTRLALMAASIYPAYYQLTAKQYGATPHAEELAVRGSLRASRLILAALKPPVAVVEDTSSAR